MNSITQENDLDKKYHDPNLIKHLSQAKRAVWRVIKSNWTKIRDNEFKLDTGAIAAELDVSRTTVYHAVKTFISGNLLEKVREVRGRGNHSTFRLLWTFDPENETPPRKTTSYDSPPRKNITKDSPGYRYYAMKFRRICNKSEQLAAKETGVTGKLLDILRGKVHENWKTAKIFFNRKVENGMDIQGFFVWLNDFLKPKLDKKENGYSKQQAVRDQVEQKKDELENLSGEPPKPEDFESFEKYGDAYDKWVEQQQ